MAFQNVFVLGGTGNVGREFIEQVRAYDGPNKGHRNPTRIVGVSNSTDYVLNPAGIAIPSKLSDQRGNINTFYVDTPYTHADEIIDAVRRSGLEGEIIFVDVSAEGQKMIDFHTRIIQDTTNGIVTANKKPAAADMDTFRTITADPHRYRYNTTVMAGAGAVPYFQESHGLSETIESVEGTFSGTLAYVCSELEKGVKPFSQIVAEAKDAGYTEPNPMDDLNGKDVMRKLLILLRSAGINIEEKQVHLEGFINPEEYTNPGVDFLEAIKKEDVSMKGRVDTAALHGLVPRYVASYKKVDSIMSASVGLQFVAKDSELGNLKGTANKVMVSTSQRTPLADRQGKIGKPHIIQSPGAGVEKTAASVRADLLYLLRGTNLWQHN